MPSCAISFTIRSARAIGFDNKKAENGRAGDLENWTLGGAEGKQIEGR